MIFKYGSCTITGSRTYIATEFRMRLEGMEMVSDRNGNFRLGLEKLDNVDEQMQWYVIRNVLTNNAIAKIPMIGYNCKTFYTITEFTEYLNRLDLKHLSGNTFRLGDTNWITVLDSISEIKQQLIRKIISENS